MAFNPEESEFNSTEPNQLSFPQNLELRLKILKKEQRTIIRQNKDFEKLLKDSLSEINKIKRPPLIVATIQEIIDHEKVIVKTSTGQTLLVNYSSDVNPQDLVPGVRCALNQRHLNIIEVLYNINDPLIKGMEKLEDNSNLSYSDIGGLNGEISEVIEAIELSLSQPETFIDMGIDAPNGVLLFGPPGNGKTLIARAIAKKTNSKFISLIGSELVQKYIGEGSRLVRELFNYAKETGPSIIFIDEIDAIGSKRTDITTSGDREVQRTFMQLLAEIDGFRKISNVKIIAATNRPEILDPALIRNGRFDRHVLIPRPSFQGRLEIFKIYTRKLNTRKDIDLQELCRMTDGFSGSEIKFLSIEAGLNAIRNRRVKIRQKDFVSAIDKVSRLRIRSNDIDNPSINLYK